MVYGSLDQDTKVLFRFKLQMLDERRCELGERQQSQYALCQVFLTEKTGFLVKHYLGGDNDEKKYC